ncbi:MAG: radical SAM protein [Pseudobdellovibrionaceae bacterium]|nr:radical SAM protein [Pseudobdellovibrionaceae bacterium]
MPIHPYVFVLVSTVARRFGLTVARQDLLHIEKDHYRELLSQLITEHQPRMIGLHIRQLDSLVYDNYSNNTDQHFLPLQTAKEVMAILKELTEVPVVIGGIGYSIQAEGILRFLGADFGVMDDPDGFFARFDQVLVKQDLCLVPNLLYWDEEGHLIKNKKLDFVPSPIPEYTPEIMEEIRNFYPVGALMRIEGPSVAIEVMRGCPYRCDFCVEPKVKGRRIRERDIDVVMEDLRFVANQGVRKVWFICSELNAHMEFALRLAERMRDFNESRGSQRVFWMAYLLPTIQEEDYLTLRFCAGLE